MTAERKKEKSDTLIRICKNIERSMSTNEDNILRYNHAREFVLKSTLSTKMRNSLNALNKPALEMNYCNAYLNRLRGEFVENEPSCSCSISEGVKVDENLEMQREIVEGHLRYIMAEARRNGTFEEIFFEVISGGFSASKVSAVYDNGKTFNQKIVWEKVYDPTLTGFDVLSRSPSKKESTYSFELHPYSKEQFEQMFDVKVEDVDFSKSNNEKFAWFYKISDEEVIVVADYYEKKKVKTKIVELSDGAIIEKKDYQKLIEEIGLTSLEAPPIIVNERSMEYDKIMRYQLIGNTILEEEEVKNVDILPHIFFSGNPAVLSHGSGKSYIMERPFLIDCEGVQKMTNNIMITLADEVQTYSQQKIMIAEESISPNYEDHITQPQKYSTLVYRAFYNNDPNKPNPMPQQLARPCFSPEILALFSSMPSLFQNILGSYDAQMGISGNTQISGVAITQGAIHSSATAKPYISNFMLSLNQVANVILHMIPKIFINEFTLPVIDQEGKQQQIPVNGQGQPSLKFDPNNLKVVCEAGVGSSAAKSQSMQQLIQLSQASPIFSQFLNTKCLPELVGNLEIHDKDLIVLKAEQFAQELEQQQKVAQEQQAQMAGQSPAAIKQMELQFQAQKAEMQAKLDEKSLEIKNQEIEFKKEEMEAKLITEQAYLDLEKDKLQLEHDNLDIQRAQVITSNVHKNKQHEHQKSVDHAKLNHSAYDLHHKHKVTGNPHF